jgi:hypothetical protein
MTGQRYGRLTVLSFFGTKHEQSQWLCRCDCGIEKVVYRLALVRNVTRSCGCLQKDMHVLKLTKHGQSRTSEYKAWHAMIQRCENSNNQKWHRYGGRGIRVCDRWHVFANFVADMGSRPEGMTIDRIDNNGMYEPSNCRWATQMQQGNNRNNNRRFHILGETITLSEAARKYAISKGTVRSRLRYGWDEHSAFLTKVKTTCC